MSEAPVSESRPETAERQITARDVAVEFGEYYMGYFIGRRDVDKPHDRLDRRNELSEFFPSFSTVIVNLDESLERSEPYVEQFRTSPLPKQDPEDPRSVRMGNLPLPIPPDYTFSIVRNPVVRKLLDTLNIAGLDDSTLDDNSMRPQVLKENGEKIIKAILGENYDPHALVRIKLVDVLTAVFDGALKLPEFPGKPIPADRPIEQEDFNNGMSNHEE